ncbi:MAG: hypothetical protein ACKVU4_13605 [Phycisphaerales bacterium]
MNMRVRRAAALAAAVVAVGASGAAGLFGLAKIGGVLQGSWSVLYSASALHSPAQPQPPSERSRDRQFAAWIPPGEYHAIVLCSSGDERRWAVSLTTTSKNVPIVVPANDNVVIEFKEGWTVQPNDEARIVSRLVPFDDAARFNKLGERPDYVLSAWGIGPNGPVEFAYREIK